MINQFIRFTSPGSCGRLIKYSASFVCSSFVSCISSCVVQLVVGEGDLSLSLSFRQQPRIILLPDVCKASKKKHRMLYFVDLLHAEKQYLRELKRTKCDPGRPLYVVQNNNNISYSCKNPRSEQFKDAELEKSSILSCWIITSSS